MLASAPLSVPKMVTPNSDWKELRTAQFPSVYSTLDKPSDVPLMVVATP